MTFGAISLGEPALSLGEPILSLGEPAFADARRLTEVLLAWAVVQQGLEHMAGPARDRGWCAAQIVVAIALAAGVAPGLTAGLLLLVSLAILQRFQGPYNGGSDRLRLLMIGCLWASHVAPSPVGPRLALGYLAVQVVLSYTMAGWVKLANRDWRNGQALTDVFAFSTYPVSEGLRAWAGARGIMVLLSWTLIAFEVLFPLALANPTILPIALVAAALFHLVNACVFGLNRFLWVWVASYPCLLWFQREVLLPAL